MMYPLHLERMLAARLKRRMRVIRTVILEHLRHLPRHDETRPRPPAASWMGATIRVTLERVRSAIRAVLPLTPSSLMPVAAAIDHSLTQAIVRIIGKPDTAGAVARPLQTQQTMWSERVVQRVRDLEDATIDRTVTAAVDAADQGANMEQAAKEALDKAEVHAALVARDETGKLASEVSRARSVALGSEEYRWMSQRDDRVRTTHVHLDGQVLRWDTPHPTEAFPGWPPMCRCYAVSLPHR